MISGKTEEHKFDFIFHFTGYCVNQELTYMVDDAGLLPLHAQSTSSVICQTLELSRVRNWSAVWRRPEYDRKRAVSTIEIRWMTN